MVRIITIYPIWSIFFSLIEHPAWNSVEFKYKMVCIFSCAPLDILNIYWFGKMLRILIKRMRMQVSEKVNGISEKQNQSLKQE